MGHWIVTLRHVTLRHVTLRHVTLCHVTLRHVTLRHIALRHVTLRHVALRHVTLRHVTLRHVALRHIALRHVALRHVALRHVALPRTPDPPHVDTHSATLLPGKIGVHDAKQKFPSFRFVWRRFSLGTKTSENKKIRNLASKKTCSNRVASCGALANDNSFCACKDRTGTRFILFRSVIAETPIVLCIRGGSGQGPSLRSVKQNTATCWSLPPSLSHPEFRERVSFRAGGRAGGGCTEGL